MSLRNIFLYALIALIAVSGCETLKTSKPIIPMKEYERLIVGRFDANYIGTDNCLSACHYHDKIRRDFEASTMGAQMSSKSGLPIVDCESCHGPGSLAVERLTKEKVEEDAKKGIQTECDYKTLINFKELPPPAMSLICLKCHTSNATFNLHNWNASNHAISDVTCFDCHRIHAGPDLIVRPRETFQMCFKCHDKVRADFNLPSRHPIVEGKVTCTDCHNPHGSSSDTLLRKDSIKETCAQCHQEKAGPFVFEHADTMDDCTSCHANHGSTYNNLLKQGEPFLCLQCHEGHFVKGPGGATSKESKAAFYTRCTDCHSAIHGTDIPSASGRGRFIE